MGLDVSEWYRVSIDDIHSRCEQDRRQRLYKPCNANASNTCMYCPVRLCVRDLF